MNPKCESSSVFPYGPHPNNRIALPPPKPSPVPSVPGYIYIWPFGRGSQDGNQIFRMSGCFRTLTLSVCLSVLSFSVHTLLETQFLIVPVFSPIVW